MNSSPICRLFSLALVAGLLTTNAAPAQTAPTAGLIHQWHFDETSGTTAFDSVGTWNFNLLNGAAFTAAGIGSSTGLKLDGVDDYLLTPTGDTSFMNAAFTLSLWVFYVTPPGKPGLLGLGACIGLEPGFGSPVVTLSVNGSLSASTANYRLDDNRWHLLSVVVANGKATLYFDAAAAASTSAKYATTQTGTFILGGDAVTHFFKGEVDEVSIYNRALSPAEIASAAAVPEPTAMCLVAGIVLLVGARRIPGRVGVSPAGLGVLA